MSDTQEKWVEEFEKRFLYDLTGNISKQIVKDIIDFIRKTREEAKREERVRIVSEAKKIQKANIEQYMVFMFRKFETFIHISSKRTDLLWSNMCKWCEEYKEKPYKNIDSLTSKEGEERKE